MQFAVQRNPVLTATSVTYPSGVTAAVSPAATTVAASSLTFASAAAADGSYTSEVTLDFTSGAVTMFGARAAVAGGKGTILMTLTITNGVDTKTVPYYLVAPFPVKVWHCC